MVVVVAIAVAVAVAVVSVVFSSNILGRMPIVFQLYHYAERVCDMMSHCGGQQFQDLCVTEAVSAFFPQVYLPFS